MMKRGNRKQMQKKKKKMAWIFQLKQMNKFYTHATENITFNTF